MTSNHEGAEFLNKQIVFTSSRDSLCTNIFLISRDYDKKAVLFLSTVIVFSSLKIMIEGGA